MDLSHEWTGTGRDRVVVLAHGILGSKNNWRGFARRLVEARPAWSVILLDLRNHGESHGFLPPHSIAACADDVRRTLEAVDTSELVLIGHSFGGKVVFEAARQGIPGLAEAWSLDSPPGLRTFDTGRQEIDRVLEAVGAVPLPLPTRQSLIPILRTAGLSEKLAQWMTTNLRPGEGGLEWKFELDTIPEMLSSFGQTDLWSYVLEPKTTPKLVTVRGGRSDRWSKSELARVDMAVRAGRLEDHVIPDAGHWLHTDAPDQLLDLVLR